MSQLGTKLATFQPVRYARLLHDYQWMKYKSRTVTPGWAGLRSTPQTVPLFTNKSLGRKDDIWLGAAWTEYLKGLHDERGFKFIMWPPAGWFNKNTAADTLGFGGNVVEVLSIEGKGAQVKTFDVSDKPPHPATWNFETHPEIVHKFTVISHSGAVINPAEGVDIYVFLIGRGPLYVDLKRLEFFPKLPVQIKVNANTLPCLLVKDAPGGKNIDRMLPLEAASVYEYAPRGTYVWGRTPKGWIALCWYPDVHRCRYFTSWRMNTIPPVPPRSKA